MGTGLSVQRNADICRHILLDNSVYGLLPRYENALTVILNLIQNLIKIMRYETLKQVQHMVQSLP